MEKFQALREEALKNYRIADHMLNVTYRLIQDTKLLLGATDNLFSALVRGMSAILHHERVFKLVPPFQENFESLFQSLHQKRGRYNLSQEYFDLMLELREIVSLHKTSPVEFRRKDRFVICTHNYKIEAITVNQLKDYLKKTGEFLKEMERITSRYERIFKGGQRPFPERGINTER